MSFMDNKVLVGIIFFATITVQSAQPTSAANPDCAELQKRVEAIFADPRAEQCDGNLDGACGDFWRQLDPIYDRMDELNCPVDEADERIGRTKAILLVGDEYNGVKLAAVRCS